MHNAAVDQTWRLTLRSATDADTQGLSLLGIDSFVAKFGHLYRAEDLATYLEQAHSEAAIAAELANRARLYQLAERSGRLVGYCKVGLICGFPEFARGHEVIEVKQLYTAPDATGSGIGAALMEWVFSEAKARGAHSGHRRHPFSLQARARSG